MVLGEILPSGPFKNNCIVSLVVKSEAVTLANSISNSNSNI